jgi:putative membrane protein
MIDAATPTKAKLDLNTKLALERTYLSDERTLMGWIRTALSMISFGFTIGKLGQVLEDVNFKGPLGRVRTVSVRELAYVLVLLGTLALVWAMFQSRIRVRGLRAEGFEIPATSIAFWVGLVLVAIGGFALTSLVLAT